MVSKSLFVIFKLKMPILLGFCLVFIALFYSFTFDNQSVGKYSLISGEVRFVSKADLETIQGTSKALKGALDPLTRSVAFKVSNVSFLGFNSQLQREHFNEN